MLHVMQCNFLFAFKNLGNSIKLYSFENMGLKYITAVTNQYEWIQFLSLNNAEEMDTKLLGGLKCFFYYDCRDGNGNGTMIG